MSRRKSTNRPFQARQGDIFFEAASIPKEANAVTTRVIAEGEATGHMHRLEDHPDVSILMMNADMYIRNSSQQAIQVLHDEHFPVTLPPGEFKVVRQVERTPFGFRTVAD